ncbi:hypothetical protein AB0C21_00510 [Spirillospora sp. NPDC049024]
MENISQNPAPVRTEIEARFRRLSVQRAAYLIRQDNIEGGFSILIFAFGAFFSYLFASSVAKVFPGAFILYALLGLVVLGGPITVPFIGRRKLLSGAWMFLSGPLIILAASSELQWQMRQTPRVVSGVHADSFHILNIGITTTVLALTFYFSTFIFSSLENAYKVRKCADIEIFHNLLKVLAFTHTPLRRYADLKYRNRAILQLHRAAYFLENGIPRIVRCPSASQHEQVKERCARSAEALRGLELRLALSDQEARQEVSSQLRAVVRAVLTSDYGALILVEARSSGKRKRFAVQIYRTMQTLIVGIVPLGVIVACNALGVKLSQTWGNAATIFAIGWAVVTYLALVDPSYRTKISTIQEMTSLFKIGIRGTEKPSTSPKGESQA